MNTMKDQDFILDSLASSYTVSRIPHTVSKLGIEGADLGLGALGSLRPHDRPPAVLAPLFERGELGRHRDAQLVDDSVQHLHTVS